MKKSLMSRMSVLRSAYLGHRFRFGQTLGLLLKQEQAAGSSKGSALHRNRRTLLNSGHYRLFCASSNVQTQTLLTHKVEEKYTHSFVVPTCSELVPSRTYSINTPRPSGSESLSDSATQGQPRDSPPQKQQGDQKPPSSTSPEPSPGQNEDEGDGTSVGIFKRFKNAYKEYGKLLVCVHVATSCVWYGSFVYAVATGVDVIPLLEYMGASETIIKPFRSGLGNFAAAYLLYKIATPARYTVTIVGTQLTARQLRRLGYMKPVPEGDKFRELMSDSKDKVKDKVSERREQVRDKIDDYKDRAEEIRGDVKERMQERKEKKKQKQS